MAITNQIQLNKQKLQRTRRIFCEIFQNVMKIIYVAWLFFNIYVQIWHFLLHVIFTMNVKETTQNLMLSNDTGKDLYYVIIGSTTS